MNGSSHPLRTGADERSLGPDAVRALAALLVVYLHACVPYLVHPMPSLVWPVIDASSALCDPLFWSIEVFIMPLFLVISGFYGYRAYQNKDGAGFLKARARRLLSPLLFGMLVILPIDLYIWMLGLIAEGHMSMSKLRSLKVPSPHGDHLWGLSHLWFLLYVFLYAAVMAFACRSIRPFQIPMRVRPALRHATIWVLGIVGTATLIWAPEVVFDFQHATLPVPSKWLYSSTFFAGGVALAIFDPQFRIVNRLSSRHLALGAAATVAVVALGRWTLRMQDANMDEATTNWHARVSLAGMTVLGAWMMSLGIIGMANRIAPRLERRTRTANGIRYLAGASFWIYLVHHPVLGVVHINLKWLTPSLSPFAKSLLSLLIAVGWAVLSYEWMVRSTRFGGWIGVTSGKRNEQANDSGKLEDQSPSDDQKPSKPHSIRIAA